MSTPFTWKSGAEPFEGLRRRVSARHVLVGFSVEIRAEPFEGLRHPVLGTASAESRWKSGPDLSRDCDISSDRASRSPPRRVEIRRRTFRGIATAGRYRGTDAEAAWKSGAEPFEGLRPYTAAGIRSPPASWKSGAEPFEGLRHRLRQAPCHGFDGVETRAEPFEGLRRSRSTYLVAPVVLAWKPAPNLSRDCDWCEEPASQSAGPQTWKPAPNLSRDCDVMVVVAPRSDTSRGNRRRTFRGIATYRVSDRTSVRMSCGNRRRTFRGIATLGSPTGPSDDARGGNRRRTFRGIATVPDDSFSPRTACGNRRRTFRGIATLTSWVFSRIQAVETGAEPFEGLRHPALRPWCRPTYRVETGAEPFEGLRHL